MSNILVTGGCSGLGKAIMLSLGKRGHYVRSYDLNKGCDVRVPNMAAIDEMFPLGKPLDVLINCAGINRIGWLQQFSEADWDDVMDVNAKGIFMMTKACMFSLEATRGTVVNIVSNAAHMPMTASAAYNASKGAAHILTKQLARELTPKSGITVFGIAPNKLRGTGMSADIERQVLRVRGWTPEFAAEYQRKALLTGEETPPEALADFIAYLLRKKENHKYLSGCILPYGA